MKNGAKSTATRVIGDFFNDYGMVFVLLLLCALFSIATYNEQHPVGESAGRQLTAQILSDYEPDVGVFIAARGHQEDSAFAAALSNGLEAAGFTNVVVVRGSPRDARQKLVEIADRGQPLGVIACNQTTAGWLVFSDLSTDFPALGAPQLVQPTPYWWPDFLKPSNIINVANQIAVIAIVGVGMTMVIITAGIDLSVGSLIALSAVASTLLIRDVAGAQSAGATGMLAACLAGIFLCAAIGTVSGVMVTRFAIPPFIVTLAMMLVASGFAYILSHGESIFQVPDAFVWLGRGADLINIPNAVVVMLGLYAVAHLVMSRTVIGRYLYAVGGNREAARLSGVPVRRVILMAYATSGGLAGLGGVVVASQLKSGSPTYGLMAELDVIAAVVVGGTSLAGGEGKMLGSLIGAFIIGVIRNGMNLMNVESYTQKVVLGLVILGAVFLDNWKQGKFRD